MHRSYAGEVALALAIPLEKNSKRMNQREVARAIRDLEDPEVVMEEEVEEPVEYEVKDCYTIDEIVYLLDHGVDVMGMKICLFDINFDFDSYDLGYGVCENLKKFAHVMRKYPEMTIRINGIPTASVRTNIPTGSR